MNKLVGILDYPHHAGAKEPTTSTENAERIERSGRAKTLRERVKAEFETGIHVTADEMAELLGEPPRAIQPRVAELRAQGLIEPSGIRRKGSGGGTAHVWRWVK